MGEGHGPPKDLEPVTDLPSVSAALGDLLRDRTTSEGIRVEALVPGSFEAYARILHPARRLESGNVRWERWSEIAAGTGATLTDEVPFRRITVPPGTPVPPGPAGARPEDDVPVDGSLPEDETRELVELLRPFATTPCWFLLWGGWGDLDLDPHQQVSVSWLHNGGYLVFRGPLDAVPRSGWSRWWRAPSLWLPEDRAWCVGTELDDFATYVGGPRTLIERIVGSDRLEALRTRRDAPVVRRGEWHKP